MTEFFFILTVIFIAYIVFEGEDNSGQDNNKKVHDANLFNPSSRKTVNSETIATEANHGLPEKTKPVQPVKSKPKVNKLAAPKIELRTVVMKNPATGEEVKVSSNYRMVKRWVKEALVEEGLLEKIYKNNELDDSAKAIVADALSIIKAMDKYKA